MSEIKIKNVEIKMGEKTIKISLEQAKELKAALNEIFPDPITIYPQVVPCPIYPPQWEYTYTSRTDSNAGNICVDIAAT